MLKELVENISPAVPRTFSIADWRYDPRQSKRDLRLDLLRGFFLFCMLVYHYHESWMVRVTYESFGLVSAAEGFVFLSGMVVGLVYLPILQKQGIGAALRKAWRRALHLYLADVISLAAIVLLGIYVLPLKAVTRIVDETTMPELVRDIFTLRLAPLGYDILLLYIILLLFTPLALWLIHTGRTRWLIAASIAIYLLYRFSPETFMWQFSNKDTWRFPVMVWQILFVAGLVTATHRAQLWQVWHRLAPLRPAIWVTVFFVLFFVMRHWPAFRIAVLSDQAYDLWFDKTMLGVGRLFNALVIAIALTWAVTRFWQPLARGPGNILIPLGQASLYVFLVHLVMSYVYRTYSSALPFESSGIYELLSIFFIWFLVRRKFLFRYVPH